MTIEERTTKLIDQLDAERLSLASAADAPRIELLIKLAMYEAVKDADQPISVEGKT